MIMNRVMRIILLSSYCLVSSAEMPNTFSSQRPFSPDFYKERKIACELIESKILSLKEYMSTQKGSLKNFISEQSAALKELKCLAQKVQSWKIHEAACALRKMLSNVDQDAESHYSDETVNELLSAINEEKRLWNDYELSRAEPVKECEIKIDETPSHSLFARLKPALLFAAGATTIAVLHWLRWITIPQG